MIYLSIKSKQKNKAMKKTVLILISLFLSVIGYAQTFVANGITYEVITGTNNQVNAIDYNTASGTQVTIPKTVTNPNTSSKYSVIGIGNEAFKSKGLTSLTLSEGLTTIGTQAFWSNSLTSLVIPNSVTQIGANSFVSNQLNTLDLGTGVEYILTQAFTYNDLTSVVIPSSVVYLGAAVFGENDITTVTIQDGVQALGVRTFWGNPLVTIISESITPPSITTDGNDDTYNMTGPTNDDRINIDLIIPFGTSADYAAATWTGFKSITETQGEVGDNFTVDYITYSVTSINPNKVKTISYDALGGTDVVIPATVSTGSTSFDVVEIGVNSFKSKNLTSVDIPTGAWIRSNSFSNNNLTSVTFPDGASTIQTYAFQNNPITSVISLGVNPPLIGASAFDDRSLIELTIPVGSEDAYLVNPGYWSGFKSVNDPLGVNDYENSDEINVIATANELSIITAEKIQFNDYVIYSTAGALAGSGNVSEDKVDISLLSNGIYIIALSTDEGKVVKRFLK